MPTDRELWLNQELSTVREQLDTANEWCSAGQRMELKALRERDAARDQVRALVAAAEVFFETGDEESYYALEAAIATAKKGS